MAYIYKYQLRDMELRNTTFLTQFTDQIQTVLSNLFDKNLKDSFVRDGYFRFALYASVPAGILQEMGRRLKAQLKICGFIRMEQTLYALVYSPQDNQREERHIEFIDSMLLDEPELFTERAMSFINNRADNRFINERSNENSFLGIVRNYYIDVLDTYADVAFANRFFSISDDVSVYYITGFHRRYNDYQIDQGTRPINLFHLDKCFDAGYLEYSEQISIQDDNKSDYLEHKVPCPKGRQTIDEIMSKLHLLISRADSIDALDGLKNGSDGSDDGGDDTERTHYRFSVHNVGQGLATSLAVGNEIPFLYFDYGMAEGSNSFTKPPCVNIPLNSDTTIILSHVHRDHWFGVSDIFGARQCKWFIPDQPRKVQLNRVLAETFVHGGSVHIIANNVVFGRGALICSTTGSHNHETGLSIRIEAEDTQGNDLNIFIAGDQRYDFIAPNHMNNLDLLVASHHGGEYCRSNHGCLPHAKSSNSIVIYSYGQGNTHGHPSNHTADYNAANWVNEHHTSIGDYEIDIYL